MLTTDHDAAEANDMAADHRSLLDEIVRDGARPMLTAVLQAEVAAYAARFADQLDETATAWWCATAITRSARC